MKKHKLKAFIKIEVAYLDKDEKSRTWECYGEVNESLNIRIFNPYYKVSECCGRNFFVTKCEFWGSKYVGGQFVYDEDLILAITNILAKGQYWGFRSYESILSIKVFSRYKDDFKQVQLFRFLHDQEWMETVFIDDTVNETHYFGVVAKEVDDYVAF